VPALTRRGIALMITPEANAASVAEHALMLMLRPGARGSAGVGRGAARRMAPCAASPAPSSWAGAACW
jgi:phosphoglycerate dehydrogenase-like enzyme